MKEITNCPFSFGVTDFSEPAGVLVFQICYRYGKLFLEVQAAKSLTNFKASSQFSVRSEVYSCTL